MNIYACLATNDYIIVLTCASHRISLELRAKMKEVCSFAKTRMLLPTRTQNAAYNEHNKHTTRVKKPDVYFDRCPHALSRNVYTIHPPFPYMRAFYYAIRERVPRNSKGAQGISLSNMTGHGRPTHPFFVRTRTSRAILPHCLLISKTFSQFSSTARLSRSLLISLNFRETLYDYATVRQTGIFVSSHVCYATRCVLCHWLPLWLLKHLKNLKC